MRLPERCADVLGDYAFELETGRRLPQPPQDYPKRPPPPTVHQPLPALDAHHDRVAEMWERDQLKVWAAAGRLTEDGVLRVPQEPAPPYTLADVARLWPQLRAHDLVAILIDLDGVVEEGYMEAHQHIRKVVQQFAREEVQRALSGKEGKTRLAEIVQEQVAAILKIMRAGDPLPMSIIRVGGHKQKCGRCRKPGHRADNCPRRTRDI